jgi:malate dehydrogenase
MKPKISIIGSGMVGGQAAFVIGMRGLGDIVLIDRDAGVAKGKALDILQAMPIFDSSVSVVGGDDYELVKDSNVVVITAGVPRKPGMTREDLVKINAGIVEEVTQKVVKYAPDCVLVVVTNPLDVMSWVALKASGFPRERVVGMAGALDGARFRAFLAVEANVDVDKISATVLGSHGEAMVPMERFAKIDGKLAVDVLSENKLKEVVKRVQDAGAEIVNYLETGSAYYAPGVAVAEVVEAIVRGDEKTIPCSVLLDGEYGVDGCFVGVPVVLGRKGIQKIVELNLTDEERKQFDGAVNHIKELMGNIDNKK